MPSNERLRARNADRKSPDILVRDIVSRTCGLPLIRDDHSLSRDLYIGSGTRAELVMAIELAFRIDFSDSEVTVVDTVGDLINLVRWKTRSFPGAPGATTTGNNDQGTSPSRRKRRANGA